MLKLVSETDPVLLQPALKVEFPNGDIERLAADMMETMVAHKGCGLAAPQVGISLRLFVFDDGIETGVVINPVIVELQRGSQIGCREGCLTMPGKTYKTMRSSSIWCNWFGLDGKRVGLQTVGGFRAIIMQHETDHLNGILISSHGTLMEGR